MCMCLLAIFSNISATGWLNNDKKKKKHNQSPQIYPLFDFFL